MRKKLLAVAALAACSLAQAYEKEYDITYTGFYDNVSKTFDSDLTLRVNFVVDDLNNDGQYSLDEVKKFTAYDIAYYGSCSNDLFIEECLYSFSYVPGQAPNFSASRYFSDEVAGFSTDIISGVSLVAYGSTYYESWSWTADTTMSVVSTVPEPGAYVMLTVGLGGMLAFARRRRAVR